MDFLEKNRDIYVNFGLIAVGRLEDIERLQQLIFEQFKGVRVVYQTVTAKRLKLVKVKEVDFDGKREGGR